MNYVFFKTVLTFFVLFRFCIFVDQKLFSQLKDKKSQDAVHYGELSQQLNVIKLLCSQFCYNFPSPTEHTEDHILQRERAERAKYNWIRRRDSYQCSLARKRNYGWKHVCYNNFNMDSSVCNIDCKQNMEQELAVNVQVQTFFLSGST